MRLFTHFDERDDSWYVTPNRVGYRDEDLTCDWHPTRDDAICEAQKSFPCAKFDTPPTFYSVAFVKVARCYGGPEEGGWYYDTSTPIKERRVYTFSSRRKAANFCRHLNDLLEIYVNKDRRPLYSVLSDFVVHAELYNGVMPYNRPVMRPFYH
jgi:hypothetical protein